MSVQPEKPTDNRAISEALPQAGGADVTKDAFSTIANSSETPYPAVGAAAALFAALPSSSSKPGFKPARPSILGFGAAFALGGFMIYDGDLVNGAGFTSAWSALYLMVNGKAAIKQMRPVPLGIAGLVTFNAINYGRQFFFPKGPVEFSV